RRAGRHRQARHRRHPTLRAALCRQARDGSRPHDVGAPTRGETLMTKRYIDLSVTVDDRTMSPPSTNLRLEVTPHRRGPGFWQVSSVHQSLHTGAHIDSPLHVFADGLTTAATPPHPHAARATL